MAKKRESKENEEKRRLLAHQTLIQLLSYHETLKNRIAKYETSNEQILSLIRTEEEIFANAKKARKLRKRLKGTDDEDNLEEIIASYPLLLEATRIKYIRQFNKDNSLNLDEVKILSKIDKKDTTLRIHRIVFYEMVASIIPSHPKDEYVYARSIKRHFVIHCGDTNTGKTYNALEALKKSSHGIYLGPLRLLALEVYHKLNEEGTLCSLSTGEEDIIVEGARHMSSTVEKLKTTERYDMIVIDEAQMVADKQRGHAWTTAILGGYANEIHICCSPNAVSLLLQLIIDCEDTYEVRKYVRDTELQVEHRKKFEFPRDVQKGDALIVFSKRMVMSLAAVLQEKDVLASLIYGDLPPETRRKQVQLFLNGETDVVIATDAIGMGLNLPIRRIVFMETEKFDGENMRMINASEVKQISGRAGRKNIYDIGYINAVSGKMYIASSLKTPLYDITRAYYLPAKEYVLGFPVGTLEERLSACLEARRGMEYFAQSDISEPLNLMYSIRRLKETNKKIDPTMDEEYRLAFIPFDSDREELMEQWLNYVKSYSLGNEIPYPVLLYESLDGLETFYKALNLYYAFSRTMNLSIDADQVLEDKRIVSDKIHEILRKDVKTFGRTCRICGKKLPYYHKYSICEECYYKRFW